MRVQKGLVLATLAAAAVTCSFPTDESRNVFVTIESLDTALVVRRGALLNLYARLWHVAGTDTVEIQNVRFVWSTENPAIATVQPGGFGAATVTGVNAGLVSITARAAAFERAQPGQFTARVAEPVEVDSVRPRVVRWGEKLTVYGVGVDSMILGFLGPVTLFDYPIPGLLASRTRDRFGFSTASFWVPPPARTDSISYIGPGVFGFARETTYVLPFDVYEPNETTPWPVDLERPPIVPQIPALRFFNPAIAFELPRRDQLGADWYRFTQTTARDLTIIINSSEARGTFLTYLSDSLYWNPADSSYRLGRDSWTIGSQLYACHGYPFEPIQTRPDSTIVALRQTAWPPVLHALAVYAEPGRYGLTALEGYVVSNPLFPRDDHEEDDFCHAADAQPHPSVDSEFRDTLTIDNPFEVDWIRFRVTTLSTVQFRLASLVPGETASDIDLYVLSDTTGGLAELASGVKVGSSESFAAVLGAGEYYAVVVDYAGVPLRYALCAGAALGACATFPAPPSGAAAAQPKGRSPARFAPTLRPGRPGLR